MTFARLKGGQVAERVPTLADLKRMLKLAESHVKSGDTVLALNDLTDAIEGIESIDGAMADAAHDITKMRGQR